MKFWKRLRLIGTVLMLLLTVLAIAGAVLVHQRSDDTAPAPSASSIPLPRGSSSTSGL